LRALSFEVPRWWKKSREDHLAAIFEDTLAGRNRLKRENASPKAGAGGSTRASSHWPRHTAEPHMADGGADVCAVRDNLRYAR
jgi:hypothetical protein